MNEVDKYIAQFEPEIQKRLSELRKLFFEVLLDTEESIHYNMLGYKVGQYSIWSNTPLI